MDYSTVERMQITKIFSDEVDGGRSDISFIIKLKRASEYSRKLVGTVGDAFRVEFKNGCYYVIPNMPGRIFINFVNLHLVDRDFLSLYRMDPYIYIVISAINEYRVSELGIWGAGLHSQSGADSVACVLNNCVEYVRAEASKSSFSAKINSYNRSANKNFKELSRYVDALFDRYSRILVLRVDLTYAKEFSGVARSTAAEDMKRLLRNARYNNIFKDMVGYIWKLEHGLKKGFHFHTMFFFDGSKVREDITRAKLIGEYWSENVTRGRGSYFNCNGKKSSYRSCGIGMISHSEYELGTGLYIALKYMAKADLYFKLKPEGRSLGKGNYPKPKGNRGRPREAAQVETE